MYDVTNELAYFLGFFWGDGGMKTNNKATTPKICIAQEDAVHIFPIFESLFDFQYTEYQQKNRKLRATAVFNRNKELRDFLFSMDCLDKSFLAPTKILAFLPKEFHNYFWRGYIDADGCFYKSKSNKGGRFSISSTYEQDWSKTLEWLDSIDAKNYKIYRKDYGKGRSSVIEVTYGPDIKKIGEFLYGSLYDNIGLKRKYDKFKLIVDSLPFRSSQLMGVSFHKGEGKWRSYVKSKFLGWWNTEEEAHQARLRFLTQKSAS